MTRHRRPQGFQRTDRIADQVQRELAKLMQFQVKDPRIGMVTIQQVKVSRDLSYADVYFTQLGEGHDAGMVAQSVLTNAAGYFRSELAKSLNTRVTPRLRFHYDEIPEQAGQLSELINSALEKDRGDAQRRGDADSAAVDQSDAEERDSQA